MFKIVVTEVTEKQTDHEQKWEQLYDTGSANDVKDARQYGYVAPPGTSTVAVEKQLLSQTVDKLDLVSVIKAVNGIAS